MQTTSLPAGFERPELLAERIAELIRKAIIGGDLRPGQRLIESQLAKQWRVSRAPLREAIRLLCAEGLVALSPHRGASVSEVSESGLHELFEVRSLLESFAAQSAAVRAAPRHLARLRELLADMERCVATGDLQGFYVAGLEFHNVIVDAAGNAVLGQIYDQLKQQFRRYQAVMVQLPDLPQHSVAEHRTIFQAIERRNASDAWAAASVHISHLSERFRGASTA